MTMSYRVTRDKGSRVFALILVLMSRIVLPCAGFLCPIQLRAIESSSKQGRPGIKFNPGRRTLLATPKVDITPELVRKTAGLAQIQITDEEVNSLVPRMEEFLGFVETMEEVYKSGDGTFAALSCGHNFLRDDAAERFSNVPAVMENMPVQEASYLRVPKVGEDEG